MGLARTTAGFGNGLSAVLGGFVFLARTPSTWPFAAVPVFVLVGLATAGVATSFYYLTPWVGRTLPAAGTWTGLGVEVLGWLAGALGALAGLMLATVLTPALSAPALERIIAVRERDLPVSPLPPLSFLSEVACGLRAQATAALIAAPTLFVLWCITLLIPPAGVVTLPLKYVCLAFTAAWNLLDYPLTLRGVRIRQRLVLIRTSWAPALGFGTAFALMFAVPCLGILILPAAVAGAAQLAADLGWTARSPAAGPPVDG